MQIEMPITRQQLKAPDVILSVAKDPHEIPRYARNDIWRRQ
jgi:hypothetical protein